ncbi:Hydrogen cyanide synthase subunit HcnA [Paraburkholderia caffeinitolerans]|uniref:Hydrogen cyanide synthase subunit HcnA n=1 Tax=Paraburkholderia caffeinitolerans TaxID=1723730 RepID=A0A6J5FRR0_9BURK|nr:2Fe-2S iron-sulfur cluster-binding protein [Paraburkholderia caffeinitolerans]CAB3786053.1 Hydrogen cyanide synthase subunit HcnA [Paraburkholderia caffeinitolerans]
MAETITLNVDGQSVSVARGSSVVAAVALAAGLHKSDSAVITRRSVSGMPRGPLCGMGVCQECRVTIDGVRHRLACQTLCADGMNVVTGRAAA